MKNILIITPYLPYPLNSGGNKAQFLMIDNLRNTHRIFLLIPANSDDRNLLELKEKWQNVTFILYKETKQFKLRRLLFKKIPSLLSYFQTKLLSGNSEKFNPQRTIFMSLFEYIDASFVNLINESIVKYNINIVQVEFFELLGLGPLLSTSIHKIFVHHELRYIREEREVDAYGKKSASINYLLAKNKGVELEFLRYFDSIFTLSEIDRSELCKYLDKSNVYSSPVPFDIELNANTNQSFEFENTITFLGGESHFPNKDGLEWFISQCWPDISNKYPTLKLKIIGNWSNKTVESFKYSEKIQFTGFVDDVALELKNTILIVPIRIGSGIRIKIIEAVANGIPFISTTIGAEGLPFNPEEHYLKADTSDEFLRAISLFMQNPSLCKAISLRATELLHKEFEMSNLIERRLNYYENIN